MSLNIATNLYSQTVQKNLSGSQSTLSTAMARLSSGLRINSSADDAAGLAISSRMTTIIRSAGVAVRNTNDAISMTQTADGAAGDITNSLQRMRELAVQAANGTNHSTDRAALDLEYQNLMTDISAVANGTSYNGINMLNNTSAVTFQVGVLAGDTISADNANLQASSGLSVNPSDVTLQSNAQDALDKIDSAINTVTATRAGFGATMNRASTVISALQSTIENQSAARARIMDADYATETSALSKGQVLQQAGMAMLTQANSLPQQVLSLLK